MKFSRFNLLHRFNLQNIRSSQASILLITFLMMTVGAPVVAFEPPPKSGTPKGTSGGGTRPASPSHCITPQSIPLQTLTPPSGTGFTKSQYPKFWVYLPLHQAVELEFTLQELDDRPGSSEPTDGYQVMISAPQGSGWTALDLPKDIPALKAQHRYRWTVALVCNPIDRPSEDAVVRGELIYQPNSVDFNEISRIRSNYWLDAMSKMSENRRVNWLSPSVTLSSPTSLPIADESWKALLLKSQLSDRTGNSSHPTS
jgi:hypothetical protein